MNSEKGREKVFFKYHGTGNDFILLDARDGSWVDPQDYELIKHLCERCFGVGADGLMFLETSEEADFHMRYYNADGRPSSMCGNGGRCVVAFAKWLSIFTGKHCRFTASDGLHQAEILKDGRIALEMADVSVCRSLGEQQYFLDTGSPHHVCFVDDPNAVDVLERGRAIRYADPYLKNGVNVNFVKFLPEEKRLRVRTYERGVEAETYSCGTGVTASVLAYWLKKGGMEGRHRVEVSTPGGVLEVHFNYTASEGFRQIALVGPVQKVFRGEYMLEVETK